MEMCKLSREAARAPRSKKLEPSDRVELEKVRRADVDIGRKKYFAAIEGVMKKGFMKKATRLLTYGFDGEDETGT